MVSMPIDAPERAASLDPRRVGADVDAARPAEPPAASICTGSEVDGVVCGHAVELATAGGTEGRSEHASEHVGDSLFAEARLPAREAGQGAATQLVESG